jgi:hypothetical protein
MANDLTGQKIQDTYKRVLTVGSDGLMYDGTGSLYTPVSASHEITTETSSSHAINADTASFATNFTASIVSASNTIRALGYHVGDRKLATAAAADTKGIEFGNAGDANIKLTHITSSGNISASGDISAESIQAALIVGTIDGGSF